MSGFLRRVSIKQKLWAMAALAGVIFAVMAGTTILELNHARAMSDRAAVAAEIADDYLSLGDNWDASTRDAFFYIDQATAGEVKDDSTYAGVIDDYGDAVDLSKEIERELAGTPGEAPIREINAMLVSWGASFEKENALIKAGKVTAANREVLANQRPLIASMDDKLGAQVEGVVTAQKDATAAYLDSLAAAKRILLIVTFVGLVLLGGLAYLIIRSISRPLDKIVGSLKAIASGDRTQKVDYDREDEIGAIVVALDTVVEFLDQADADAAQAERDRVARDEADREADRARQEEQRRASEAQAAELQRALDEQAERLQRAAEEQAEAARLAAEEESRRLEAEAARSAEEAARAAESSRQVSTLLEYVKQVADGDLTQPVPACPDPNVGQMADGLRSLTTALRDSMSAIGETATEVARASDDLTGVSARLGTGAESTSDLAANVSSASEEVSTSVATVASAAEEMSVSIREIAQNAAEATRVASDAVTVADSARITVRDLGEASAEIGQVVKTITSIAEQTNLLALNATIEAARAGEAGKGFAVVANEVKDLAEETARATDEIRQRIDAIQNGTSGAVDAIANISEVIVHINQIQTSIAGAVEQQTATTNEIARSVTETATVSHAIAADISKVAHAAGETREGAGTTAEAAAMMATSASQLEKLVGAFRY